MSKSTPATQYAVTVNFNQFKLEAHVQRALQKAWALAEARPLNASNLLKAVILESQNGRSKGFGKLAGLLPLSQLADVKPASVAPADLAALPVTMPLSESFSIAQGFFKDFFKDKDKN